jgi:hypothetical protein
MQHGHYSPSRGPLPGIAVDFSIPVRFPFLHMHIKIHPVALSIFQLRGRALTMAVVLPISSVSRVSRALLSRRWVSSVDAGPACCCCCCVLPPPLLLLLLLLLPLPLLPLVGMLLWTCMLVNLPEVDDDDDEENEDEPPNKLFILGTRCEGMCGTSCRLRLCV